MKNILKKVLSIAAATALLMTSVISASAVEHTHNVGTQIDTTTYPALKGSYSITLLWPEDSHVESPETIKIGAYQIFSGTVPAKGENGYPKNLDGTDNDAAYTNPGDDGTKLPITDIKWGNAFGSTLVAGTTQDDINKNILGFVYALSQAKSGPYSYAFGDFGGFESGFFSGTTLNSSYVNGTGAVTISVTDGKVTAITATDGATVNYDKLAVAVADVIAEHNDPEWLQAFNDILGGYGQGGSDTYANGGYVKLYYGGSPNSGTAGTDAWEYNINDVPAGYYMIMDLSTIDDSAEKNESTAYSARMLFVVSDVTQHVKASVPTLEKKILRDTAAVGSDGNETDVAGVGDVVHFQLDGTLPSNYDLYLGGYQYTFEDTLSDGLDLVQYDNNAAAAANANNCVTVTVIGLFKEDGSDNWTWDASAKTTIPVDVSSVTLGLPSDHHLGSNADSGQKNYNYEATYDDDARKLTVYFPCLKEIRLVGTGTGVGGNGLESDAVYRLGYNSESKISSKIYVDYYAKVNENAVVSPAKDDIKTEADRNGNDNQAQIKYSDNPQSYGDTDETTIDRATVYTFGLDIVKVDAAEFLKNGEDAATLEGAKFILVRQKDGTDDEYEIAKFAEVAATSEATDPFKGEKYYSIDSWENLGTLDSTGETTSGDTSDDTLEGLFNKLTDKTNLEIVTAEDGHLNISGLDVGVTYTMIETEAPTKDHAGEDNSYAKIKPFTITLTAQTTGVAPNLEYTGKLESADVSNAITDGDSFSIDNFVELIDPKTDADDDNGSANMLVANFKYTDLPSTGGIGVYIYYIAGGCVVALALVLFALSKKKKTTK